MVQLSMSKLSLKGFICLVVSWLSVSSISASFADTFEDFKLRSYGSFLHTERVPNALFFFDDIEANDSFELRKALRTHDIDSIVLASPGGSVWEGLSMAGIIFDKQLKTYIPKKGNCASACAFMFFAGNERLVDGQLGVHQFYSGQADKNAQIGESQESAQKAKFINSLSSKEIDLSKFSLDSVEKGISTIFAKETLNGLDAIDAKGPLIASGPFLRNQNYINFLKKEWHSQIISEKNHLSLCTGVASLIEHGCS